MFSIRAILTLLIILTPSVSTGDEVQVIEFTASYCQPCQEMKPIVAKLRDEGLTIVTCDIHDFNERARFYGIDTVPSFVAVRDNQVVKVLHGKVPEQDLRSLFETSACDRAKPGPIILPHPNGRDEDWTPAPQLPPTPQPLPPPNHGPYARQPETPRRSQGVADVLIFGWPALRGKASQGSATQPAAPSGSAAVDRATNTPDSLIRDDQAATPGRAQGDSLGTSQGTDSTSNSATATSPSTESSAQASGVTDQAGEPGGSRASGPASNKSSGTRRFFLFEWLGIGSSGVSSSSADPSIPSPDGWSKAEVLGWLISVALTAAGFKFGGPLGSWLTKAAIRGVVRLVTKKATEQTEQRERTVAPLNDDYAEQLNAVYSLSGRSPAADATLGRIYEREMTEAAQGSHQCAAFAHAMVRKVHDQFNRIHDTTPMPAEPTAGNNP